MVASHPDNVIVVRTLQHARLQRGGRRRCEQQVRRTRSSPAGDSSSNTADSPSARRRLRPRAGRGGIRAGGLGCARGGGRGRVRPHDESVDNPIGMVHGGLVCTLLDSALGCAVHSTLPAGVGYTSIELKVNYLRPVTAASGELGIARGWVTKPGRRVAFADGDVRDAQGGCWPRRPAAAGDVWLMTDLLLVVLYLTAGLVAAWDALRVMRWRWAPVGRQPRYPNWRGAQPGGQSRSGTRSDRVLMSF